MADLSHVPTEGMQREEARYLAHARDNVRLGYEARQAAYDAMRVAEAEEAPVDVRRELAADHWEACEHFFSTVHYLLHRLNCAENRGLLPTVDVQAEEVLALDHAERDGVAL